MAFDENKIKSYDGIVYQEDIEYMLQENRRRMNEIFGEYDPVTGYNCYDFDKRQCVTIKDFYVPEVTESTSMMWVLPDMFDNTMFKQIAEIGSIELYLKKIAKVPPTEENILYICKEICKMRCKKDREFSMYLGDKIQDKRTGKMVRFRLNYPQRVLHKTIEDLNKKHQGVYICLLKARQWGGSTYTQMRMKDTQDHVHDGWNAIIIAQGKKTAKKIKAMYKKAVQRQPGWILGYDGKKLQLSPYENSQDDFWVTDEKYNAIRRSILSVSAYEVVDADRGENYHMAHLSEVGVWKKTDEHDPEDVISSIMGGIDNIEDNLVVMESTGKKAYGFFYDTWKEAIDPKVPSLWFPLFIPFYIIEKDHTPLDESEEEFARWLLENKDSSFNPKGYKETGRFFWRLWKLGADFEAINWYRINRNVARSHAIWATEAPIDSIEAFRTAGNLIFDTYAIDEMRDKYVRDPIKRADIILKGNNNKDIIRESFVRVRNDEHGELEIWAEPNNDVIRAKNRYLISVDIGGNSAKADYTVMSVIDRLGTIDGMNGRPEVVARWRGHCRHDKLAWKAAVLGKYYDNALLVIESNTADRERYNNTEGDHFGTIIDVLADYYDNMYMRAPSSESVDEKPLRKYGFQTNKLTKGYVIDNLIAAVEDETFVDPDRMLYEELSIYERRDDGSLGNRPGANNHDDIVMSLAIGLYVSAYDCDKCDWIKTNSEHKSVTKAKLNEASF